MAHVLGSSRTNVTWSQHVKQACDSPAISFVHFLRFPATSCYQNHLNSSPRSTSETSIMSWIEGYAIKEGPEIDRQIICFEDAIGGIIAYGAMDKDSKVEMDIPIEAVLRDGVPYLAVHFDKCFTVFSLAAVDSITCSRKQYTDWQGAPSDVAKKWEAFGIPVPEVEKEFQSGKRVSNIQNCVYLELRGVPTKDLEWEGAPYARAGLYAQDGIDYIRKTEATRDWDVLILTNIEMQHPRPAYDDWCKAVDALEAKALAAKAAKVVAEQKAAEEGKAMAEEMEKLEKIKQAGNGGTSLPPPATTPSDLRGRGEDRRRIGRDGRLIDYSRSDRKAAKARTQAEAQARIAARAQASTTGPSVPPPNPPKRSGSDSNTGDQGSPTKKAKTQEAKGDEVDPRQLEYEVKGKETKALVSEIVALGAKMAAMPESFDDTEMQEAMQQLSAMGLQGIGLTRSRWTLKEQMENKGD